VISSIKIEAFRGVKEGQVDGLALSTSWWPEQQRKVDLLEAVALVGTGNALKVAELLLHRGGPPLDALDHSC